MYFEQRSTQHPGPTSTGTPGISSQIAGDASSSPSSFNLSNIPDLERDLDVSMAQVGITDRAHLAPRYNPIGGAVSGSASSVPLTGSLTY